MYKRLKECKSFREIFEVIPEMFYEDVALIIILCLLGMVVTETIARYIIRGQSLFKMESYFNIVGRAAILYASVWIVSRFYKMKVQQMIVYFKKNIWNLFFICFFICIVISTFLSKDFNSAYTGHWMRMSGLRTYLMCVGFFICGHNVKDNKKVKIMWWGFALSSVIQSLLIFTEYIGLYGSVCGGFYNSNHSAYFMCMAILALDALIRFEEKKYLKAFTIILMAWNVWILIINDTFGAYLAVMISIIFVLIINIMNKEKTDGYSFVPLIIFITVSIFGECMTGNISTNFSVTTKDVSKVAKDDGNVDSVGTGRGILWRECIDYIGENKFIGCGPDMLVYEIECAAEPHNEILQIAAEEGLLGAMFYMLALISLMVARIKKIGKLSIDIRGGAGMVAAYFISSMFGVIFFYTMPFYAIILGNVGNDTKK